MPARRHHGSRREEKRRSPDAHDAREGAARGIRVAVSSGSFAALPSGAFRGRDAGVSSSTAIGSPVLRRWWRRRSPAVAESRLSLRDVMLSALPRGGAEITSLRELEVELPLRPSTPRQGESGQTAPAGSSGGVRRAAVGRGAGGRCGRARSGASIMVLGWCVSSASLRCCCCARALSPCASRSTRRPNRQPSRPPARPARNAIPGACADEEMVLASVVQYTTFFAELCGALVIAVAVLRALARFVPHLPRRAPRRTTPTRTRSGCSSAKSLALALEFELAADILQDRGGAVAGGDRSAGRDRGPAARC